MNPPGIYTLYMDPYPGRSWSQYLVLVFVVALTNLTQDSGLRHRAVEHKSSHTKWTYSISGTNGGVLRVILDYWRGKSRILDSSI